MVWGVKVWNEAVPRYLVAMCVCDEGDTRRFDNLVGFAEDRVRVCGHVQKR